MFRLVIAVPAMSHLSKSVVAKGARGIGMDESIRECALLTDTRAKTYARAFTHAPAPS